MYDLHGAHVCRRGCAAQVLQLSVRSLLVETGGTLDRHFPVVLAMRCCPAVVQMHERSGWASAHVVLPDYCRRDFQEESLQGLLALVRDSVCRASPLAYVACFCGDWTWFHEACCIVSSAMPCVV